MIKSTEAWQLDSKVIPLSTYNRFGSSAMTGTNLPVIGVYHRVDNEKKARGTNSRFLEKSLQSLVAPVAKYM